MDNLPRTAEEYRRWRTTNYPNIPYECCLCGCGQTAPIAPQNHFARFLFEGEPMRYIQCHRSRAKTPEALARIEKYRQRWAKEKPDIPYGCCWCGCGEKTQLTTRTTNSRGYPEGVPQRYVVTHVNRLPEKPYRVEDCGYKTPCWIWQGSKDSKGYGRRTVDSRPQLVHRLYYEKAHGKIPDHLEPDHLCEIPSCINPEHLEPVSHVENMRRCQHTKLSMEKARKIRELYSTGQFTYATLGHMFNVGESAIAHTVRHINWREE